jgi:hypothetical protein
VASFDHLVGPRQNRRRNRETEHARRPDVDDERERGWLLNGQIGRAGAAEQAVHVGRRLALDFEGVGAIGRDCAAAILLLGKVLPTSRRNSTWWLGEPSLLA